MQGLTFRLSQASSLLLHFPICSLVKGCRLPEAASLDEELTNHIREHQRTGTGYILRGTDEAYVCVSMGVGEREKGRKEANDYLLRMYS
ncbi:hypothetical protein IW262DRAFT_270037 [Armillaria fumosa]|nr:hypothetical protein IW262DRAFT_270037 [Armillaria fumosa]